MSVLFDFFLSGKKDTLNLSICADSSTNTKTDKNGQKGKKKKKKEKYIFICNVGCVGCQVSGAMCHISYVMCHVSHVAFSAMAQTHIYTTSGYLSVETKLSQRAESVKNSQESQKKSFK